jgi:ATP-dependent Clp protease adapter protein ClpS
MAPNSPITHLAASRPIQLWVRVLAWIIVICALPAYEWGIYRFLQQPRWPNAFQALLILASLWLMPLFTYVAVKGHAPHSWPGIGSVLTRDGSASRWAALASYIGIIRPAPPVVLPPQTSLLDSPEFVPSGFKYGVEILNDNATPMQFVVSALSTHLGMNCRESVQAMLSIHKQGGALLPMASLVDAKRAAEAVTAEATHQRYPLICRAVGIEEERA